MATRLDETTSRWCSVVNAKGCSIVKMVARIFAVQLVILCICRYTSNFSQWIMNLDVATTQRGCMLSSSSLRLGGIVEVHCIILQTALTSCRAEIEI